MSISKFCIRHRVATLLAVIMIVVFGVMFGTRLQMALMPDMEAPMAIVMSYYNGATPSDMEALVTRPLESAVMSVSGVKSVSSTSAESSTTLMVTYEDGTNLDIAATKLREQFNRVTLPDGASEPVIMNMNMSEMMPTAVIALAGDDLAQLQQLAEETVSPALERIDGVARVTVSGGVTEQIAVEVDPTRAAGLGLSTSYISQFLAGQNLLFPGGTVDSGTKTLTVSTDAKFQSVDDVANMLISLPTGGTVRLNEVANVVRESKEADALSKVNGSYCVVLQVSKQSGANEFEAARAVEKRLNELSAENKGIQWTPAYLASEYISQVVTSAAQNILQGLLLAAIVVLLFLRRAGATLTIVISMPVCILSVFILMDVMDLTLNLMSMGGIAMGVGMIVDNSIVVLENITRFSAEGHDRMSACVEGTREVFTSVTASTLTTLAVFVPLALTTGIAGMLFRDFCLTIASLIFASLIISLTLVPLLCYFLLDEEKVRRDALKKETEKPGLLRRMSEKLNRTYLRLLEFFVRHLWVGMAASLGLVVVFSVTLVNTKAVLLPNMDQGMVTITINMPIGSSLKESSAIADRVMNIIEHGDEESVDGETLVPELKEMYYIAQEESVTVMVNLVDRGERERSSFEIVDELRPHLQDIAGCEITVSASSTISMGSSGGSDIGVELTGADYDTLAMLAEDLGAQIAQLPDAMNVSDTLSKEVSQVKVIMKREAAAQYGLTAATVGSAVRTELSGSKATTVTINNKELEVLVRGSGEAASSVDALRSMPISTPMGGTVPLSAVADVTVEQAPQSINRSDQSRQVTITGDTISGDATAITEQINEILANYQLPEGYNAEITSSYSDMMESFGDLLFALAVALGLVYFVLAAQFESFLMPVIVMLILPVAFTGALFALPVTGRDLSVISLVSLIMLAGTVVNASIILVEYIKIRREMGEDRVTAILHACPLRVRPILMTTLTTILAMVPMALGIGNSSEMMTDMGITMISGMGISTLITLVFTPVYYSVIDSCGGLFRRKKKKELPAETAA